MGDFDAISIQAIADQKVTKEDMTIPIDYDDAGGGSVGDPPEGTLFRTQADVDDLLAANGWTAFKHMNAVYNALPQFVIHLVTFELAAGVHRPEPSTTNYAFDWRSKEFFGDGAIHVLGPYASDWPAEGALENLLVLSHDNGATGDPSITFAASTFPNDGSLKGLFVELVGGFVGVIHDHDDATLHVAAVPTPITDGVTLAKVCRPAVIIRNSLDDIVQHTTFYLFFTKGGTGPGGGFFIDTIGFENLIFDPWADTAVEINAYGGNQAIVNCMWDRRAYVEETGLANGSGNCIVVSDRAKVSVLYCSVRNPLPRNLDNTDYLFQINDSELWLYGSYFHGTREGVSVTYGGWFTPRNVVFDQIGRSDSGTTSKRGRFFATGAGTLLQFVYFSGMYNQIRDVPARTGVPDMAVIHVEEGSLSPGGNIVLLFKDCAQDLVRLGRYGTHDNAGFSTSRLLDDGGNTGYGFVVEGPFAVCRISANSDAKGAAGDILVGGVPVDYADIEGLGDQVMVGVNIVSKDV